MKISKLKLRLAIFLLSVIPLTACGKTAAQVPVTESAEEGSIVWNGTDFVWRMEAATEDNYYNVSYRDGLESCEISLQADKFSEADWGIENGSVMNCFSAPGGDLVFVVAGFQQKRIESLYYVHTDKNGALKQMAEITDKVRETGIWDDLSVYGIILGCDQNGTLYLEDDSQNAIVAIDNNGEKVKKVAIPNGTQKYLLECFCDKDNKLFFFEKTDAGSYFFRIVPETGELQILAQGEYKEIQHCYGMVDHWLLYSDGANLNRWDVLSGEKVQLVNLGKEGITTIQNVVLDYREDQLDLYYKGKDGLWICSTYQQEKPEYKDALLFTDLTLTGGPVEAAIVAYNRQNPLSHVDYNKIKTEEEKERVLLEVLRGEGPDLMMVSYEDYRKLCQNGGLASWGDYLTEELRQNICPGVLDIGFSEGTVWGVPFSMTIQTMVTSKEYMDGAKWSCSDVMTIKARNPQIKGIMGEAFNSDDYPRNLYFMLLKDISHSKAYLEPNGFVNNEAFKNSLRFIKEQCSQTVYGGNYFDPIINGDILAKQYLVTDQDVFYAMYKYMGEKGQAIGFPTEGESGHMIQLPNGLLVVNQNAQDKKEVADLIVFLYSLQTQDNIGKTRNLSVRVDVPYHPTEAERIQGNSYEEEYRQLIRTAVFVEENTEVAAIIEEEAMAYLEGNKSLDKVVVNIQKRVDLYKSERESMTAR